MSLIRSIKTVVTNNAKNLPGWKTRRKIVVFSVDDYGNVALDSKTARENIQRAGLKLQTHFDYFDALENTEDLESLFRVLSSIRDSNNRHPIFTAFALPANIDFERMASENFETYRYELLPETYSKVFGSQSTFRMLKDGMNQKLFEPQFHGREHLNIRLLMTLLQMRNKEVITCFQNRSYVAISANPFRYITYPAAFSFDAWDDNNSFQQIITEGLEAFDKVFGVRAQHFTAPTMQEHHVLHQTLKDSGIKFIDTPWLKNEHQGNGSFKKTFNWSGKHNGIGQTFLVRNCVFEPLVDNRIDWVNYCIKQIEAAFRWNKPAIISSHRVNFSGQVEPSNRKEGLALLKSLLTRITQRWPEVEFMTAPELATLMH